MSLIDDETFLVVEDWRLRWELLRKAWVWGDSYNEDRKRLELLGWEFTSELDGDIGSDANLEHDTYFVDELGHDNSYWARDWKGDGFLPVHFEWTAEDYTAPWWQMGEALWIASGLGYLEREDHGWVSSVLPATGVFSNRYLWLRMLQRIDYLMTQYRCAKMLENIYCLDNRGRPRLV